MRRDVARSVTELRALHGDDGSVRCLSGSFAMGTGKLTGLGRGRTKVLDKVVAMNSEARTASLRAHTLASTVDLREPLVFGGHALEIPRLGLELHCDGLVVGLRLR